MSDEQTNPGAAQQPPAQPRMQALGQFVRDLSFENVAVRKGIDGNVQPEVQVAISMDARKRSVENQYEVIHKFKVTAKQRDADQIVFVLELEYGGIFAVEGVSDDAIHPFLLIECSRMMFPFERRIVADTTRDGGFPPLNLENVDFLTLYRQELQRRAQSGSSNVGTA